MKNKFTKVLLIVGITVMASGIRMPKVQAFEVHTDIEYMGISDTENLTTEHNYQEVIEQATPSKDGCVTMQCVDCSEIDSAAGYIIYRPTTVKLSITSVVYSGKEIKPSVIVTDSNNNVIDSTNYDVSYKDNKNTGKATVTVAFKGKYYSGEMQETFEIKPKTTSITSISAMPKGFALKWKKQKQVSGYQIQYSTKKNFKNAKNVWVESKSATKNGIIRLKAKKKYYVRVRTYKIVKTAIEGSERTEIEYKDGKVVSRKIVKSYETENVYSAWSKGKTVTTKKGEIESVNKKECPFSLYTVMYGDNGYPYYYGKWGGSANMDAKNWAKTEACDEKVHDMFYDKFPNHNHYMLSWRSVGTYSGMPVVQRYVEVN